MKEPLQNPYDNLDEKFVEMVQTRVSRADKSLIKQLCPTHGILQVVFGTLFSSFCNELRTSGHTQYDPIDDGEAVRSLLRRYTAPRTSGQTPSQSNTGGTTNLPSSHPPTSPQSSNSPSQAFTGSQGATQTKAISKGGHSRPIKTRGVKAFYES